MRKKPNIALTLLIAAFLVVGLSFVFPKNKEKYIGEMFWTRKTFAPSKYNVVVMGDSRVYRGVSPIIMKKALPELRILNFAYSNGGLNPTMFDAAEAKLIKSNQKNIIVMGVTANALTDYTKENNQFNQELKRPREEIVERLYLNPLRYWFSATSPEGLKQHFKPAKPDRYYLNEYHMNGYVESDKFPSDTLEALPLYNDDFTKFKVTDKNLQTLYKQIELWRAKGISVFAYRPPVAEPMRILEDSLGLYNELEIENGITRAGGHWITINPSQYKTYYGSHLNKESAERLSKAIVFEIKKILEIE